MVEIVFPEPKFLSDLCAKHVSEPVHLSAAFCLFLVYWKRIPGCFIIMCNKEFNRAVLRLEKNPTIFWLMPNLAAGGAVSC